MNEEKGERVQELFLAAQEVADHLREAWLKEQCGDDGPLFDEVMSLLEHSSPGQDPLEEGIGEAITQAYSKTNTPSDLDGIKVHCPNCQIPIEIVQLAAEVNCPSCGSHFSINDQVGDGFAGTNAPGTIAQFVLEEKVGLGSFGTVWLATDTNLDRKVALKIPRRNRLNVLEIEKFLREAKAAGQLKHPNIVRVHEVGYVDDIVFIASDFIKGTTLADLIREQRLQKTDAVKLCVKLAAAIEHAHLAGVIHRDLKPSNVLLDHENEPFLTDFGLAKREGVEVTMTLDGQILGTPAYMSPEQAKGSGRDADARSDVYSLGVILFELLTGEQPFRGNTQMLIQQVIEEDPPSPRRFDSSTPKDLETICLRCLEKNPDKRIQSAKEVRLELERWLQGKPIHSRPVNLAEQFWKWCIRRPVVAGLAASLFITLAAGATISSYFAIESSSRASELSEAYQAEKNLVEEKTNLLAEKGKILAQKEKLVAEKTELINELKESNSTAKAEAERANKNSQQTRQVLDFLLYRVFSAATPKSSTRYSMGVDVSLKDAINVAETGIKAYFRDSPELEGDIRIFLSKIYRVQRDFQKAVEQSEKGLNKYKNLNGISPDKLVSAKRESGWGLSLFVDSLCATEQYERALPFAQRLHQIRAQIVKQATEFDLYRRDKRGLRYSDLRGRSNSKGLLGLTLAGTGKFEEARELLDESYRDNVYDLYKNDTWTSSFLQPVKQVYATAKRTMDADTWSQRILFVKMMKLANNGQATKALELYKAVKGDVGLLNGLAGDLFARTGDWESSASILKKLENSPNDAMAASNQALLAALAYRLGRFDEFEDRRLTMVNELNEAIDKSKDVSRLNAILMRPLNPELKTGLVQWINTKGPELFPSIYSSVEIKSMAYYRLGDFAELEKVLNRASGALSSRVSVLIKAVIGFRDNPSAENREELRKSIASCYREAIQSCVENRKGSSWFHYLKMMAWVDEGLWALAKKQPAFPPRAAWTTWEGYLPIEEKAIDLIVAGKLDQAKLELDKLTLFQGTDTSQEFFGGLIHRKVDTKVINDLPVFRRDRWLHIQARFARQNFEEGKSTRIAEERDSDIRKTRIFKIGPNQNRITSSWYYLLPASSGTRAVTQDKRSEIMRDLAQFCEGTVAPNDCKILAGPLRYSLGEFDEWFERQPKAVAQERINVTLNAISQFRKDPSTANQESLNNILDNQEQRVTDFVHFGPEDPNYPAYILELWLLREIKASLE